MGGRRLGMGLGSRRRGDGMGLEKPGPQTLAFNPDFLDLSTGVVLVNLDSAPTTV
jgi:hypothetical protein